MKKNKLDDLTKVKLIYSGELIVIAIAVIVIGILQITNVLTIKELFRNIFNWVTIFGAPFLIATSIWAFVSPNRRKKVSLLDKITLLPIAIYIIVIDIICFINYGTMDQSFYQTYIPIALLMIGVVYIIQGVYHWYRPLPALLEELEQERIDKITYKVIKHNEDGSTLCLHVDSNKEFLFTEVEIKEKEDELFCLDQYPNAKYIENNKED